MGEGGGGGVEWGRVGGDRVGWDGKGCDGQEWSRARSRLVRVEVGVVWQRLGRMGRVGLWMRGERGLEGRWKSGGVRRG